MNGLSRPNRAFFGSLAALCVFAASSQAAAQNAVGDLARDVEEEVGSVETIDLDAAGALRAAAPMSEFPDFGVQWPDMNAVADSETGEAADAVAIDAEQRYSVALRGLDDVEQAGSIRSQFNALSQLRENDGDRAVVAQINRRADADRDTLRRIMRAHGYYDSRIVPLLEGVADQGRIEVVFEIEPGPLYTFDSVELPGLASAGERAEELRGQFPVETDDPVDAAAVTAAEVNLAAELGNRGYPFAEVGDEGIVVDHASSSARLVLPVDPGGERNFGSIRVSQGAEEIFGADHVQTIARFEPGELYSTRLVDDLRRALIQTGLISRVGLSPVEADDPGLVDLDIVMEPAPPRTIAGAIGYNTGEGARIEANWEHRNLFPPEGALGVRGIVGTQEQFAGVSFRRSNFLDRDQILSVQLFASNTSRDAYAARTAGLVAGFERVSNQLWQKEWAWSVGTELLASDERDVVLATNTRRRRTFFIAALPLGLSYDGTNDLLNPEQGFRMSALVSPELSFQDQVFGYVRVQLDGSVYVELMDALTLAGRVRLGAIPGAGREDIAPSRRFYAGGGGSVRGYSYQSIGPRDANNDPIGGRSLVEMAVEARYRFGDFGVVPFLDAGAIYTDLYPDFSNLRFGAGLGVRYYSSFGPIRVDVGTPINPQPGDPVIAVYVSLGQAF
jgi:translocation and assembly module TamA